MERHCKINCTHIYGHQDTRRRGTPAALPDPSPPLTPTQSNSSKSEAHSIPTTTDVTLPHDEISSNESYPPPSPNQRPAARPTQPSLPVCLNIKCDHIASTTSKLALGEHRQDLASFAPPYPGSRANLRIGDTWITSK
jgi:hypothetical protein